MSGKSIRLHPKHGVNPTTGQCFWCGEPDGTIALLEGDVVILTDLKTAISITSSAEEVVLEMAWMLGPTFQRYRIIYRDTMDNYDGLAQRDGVFLGFVPLNTQDRHRAVALANAGIDCNGEPWPT